jgi:hypothetical protein
MTLTLVLGTWITDAPATGNCRRRKQTMLSQTPSNKSYNYQTPTKHQSLRKMPISIPRRQDRNQIPGKIQIPPQTSATLTLKALAIFFLPTRFPISAETNSAFLFLLCSPLPSFSSILLYASTNSIGVFHLF